jgi:protein phosphatase
MAIVGTLVVLLVLAGLGIGRAIIRSNYYVAEYSGVVAILRGIQGSLLGMSLHEPYLIGCLNARNDLSLISYGQSGGHHDCELMTLQDLNPAGRAQAQAGLPGGTLDEAESQLRKLLADSLLRCPPPRATSPPAPPATAPEPSGPASPAPTTTPTPTSSSGAPPTTNPTSGSAAPSPAPAVVSPARPSQPVPAIPHCRAVA